jgi:hypothetical protein
LGDNENKDIELSIKNAIIKKIDIDNNKITFKCNKKYSTTTNHLL